MNDFNGENKIENHSYDGIEELDNPMPDWWMYLFFATIIFAFVYWVHYEFGGGLSSSAQLEQSLNQIKSLKKSGPVFTEESLAAAVSEISLSQGGQIFASKCAACHGPEGGGLIGPNLTDSSFLHGRGTRVDIAQLLVQGVLEKGMPAWADQLSPDELVQVTNLVFSMKGKNVSGGKPAQGTEYRE